MQAAVFWFFCKQAIVVFFSRRDVQHMEGNGGLSHGHFSILGPQNELSHEIWDFRWNFYFRKGLQIPSNYHQKRSLLLPSPFFFRILRSDNFKKKGKTLGNYLTTYYPPPLFIMKITNKGEVLRVISSDHLSPKVNLLWKLTFSHSLSFLKRYIGRKHFIWQKSWLWGLKHFRSCV